RRVAPLLSAGSGAITFVPSRAVRSRPLSGSCGRGRSRASYAPKSEADQKSGTRHERPDSIRLRAEDEVHIMVAWIHDRAEERVIDSEDGRLPTVYERFPARVVHLTQHE